MRGPLPGPFRLARAIFVVPDSQRAVLDAAYQLYVFELFHQSRLNKLCHFVCIPAALTCAYAALPAPAAAGLAALLLGLHLAIARAGKLPGLAPFLVASHALLLAIGAGAVARFDAAGGGLYRQPAAQILACSFLQYLAHALEPWVPAPLSTGARLQPTGAWLRSASPSRIAAAFSLLPLHVMVELISGPRNLFLLILCAAERLGYRSAALDRARRCIGGELASPRPDFARADFNRRLSAMPG